MTECWKPPQFNRSLAHVLRTFSARSYPTPVASSHSLYVRMKFSTICVVLVLVAGAAQLASVASADSLNFIVLGDFGGPSLCSSFHIPFDYSITSQNTHNIYIYEIMTDCLARRASSCPRPRRLASSLRFRLSIIISVFFNICYFRC